jgi:general secretion pathway protein E
LRQDPDCILVGEIRDPETAQTAIQASLTGHVVFSTLHTNNASSTIIRLLDLGVEPYLVSSCLLGILAQRLVRVICPHCKEGYAPLDTEKAYFKEPPKQLYRGKGCGRCLNEGYSGRTGIFELLVIDDELRAMIVSGLDARSISAKAVKKGMKTINVDGMNKVLKGITTLNEVLRVTQKEYAEI